MIEVSFGSGVRGVQTAWAERIVSSVLKVERAKRKDVSVLITTDSQIRKINREYLNHDYATDVISFGLSEKKLVGHEKGRLGDLVVSMDTAKKVSKQLKISAKEELARYLIHGTLHLLGYRDKKKNDHDRMHDRQERLLKSIL